MSIPGAGLALACLAMVSVAMADTGKADPPRGPTQFVVGNDLWQPGHQYRNGDDWLALLCTATQCSFQPAALSVHAQTWQGHYDDQPTDGQQLAFTTANQGEAKVIGWFRRDAALTWLKSGPVTTYAAKPVSGPGTLETVIDVPGGEQARFVPMYDRDQHNVLLQLRIGQRRQRLGDIGTCSREVHRDYLLWAGDLDGDGRADYLVSFDDGPVILYLSSQAKTDQVAGMGGTYDPPPYGGECDSPDWPVD